MLGGISVPKGPLETGVMQGRVVLPSTNINSSNLMALTGSNVISRPVAGAIILVDGKETMAVTDGDGYFTLSGLTPGKTVFVSAVLPGLESLHLETIGKVTEKQDLVELSVETTVAVESMKRLQIEGYAEFEKLVTVSKDNPKVQELLWQIASEQVLEFQPSGLALEVADSFLRNYYPYEEKMTIHYINHILGESKELLYQQKYIEIATGEPTTITYIHFDTGVTGSVNAIRRLQTWPDETTLGEEDQDVLNQRETWATIMDGSILYFQEVGETDPVLIESFKLVDRMHDLSIEKINYQLAGKTYIADALKVVGKLEFYDETYTMWLVPGLGVVKSESLIARSMWDPVADMERTVIEYIHTIIQDVEKDF